MGMETMGAFPSCVFFVQLKQVVNRSFVMCGIHYEFVRMCYKKHIIWSKNDKNQLNQH